MKQRVLFPIVWFFATALIMSLSKLLFLGCYHSLGGDLGLSDWIDVLYHGWSLDMTVAGYITAPVVLMMIASLWLPNGRAWRIVLRIYALTLALIAASIFATDLGLYEYWGYRIDSSLLIYLKSPREAAASLTISDWLQGALFFVLHFAALLFVWLKIIKHFDLQPLKMGVKALSFTLLLLLAGLCFLAIRGGVSVAVANVSKVYFSQNQFLNHAATNPLFSLLSTIGEDEDMKPQYLFFSEEELDKRLELLRGDMMQGLPEKQLLKGTTPDVVLIILESFGRCFTDAKGGEVTPNLNRLKSEGVWFENAFANSYRTDRGEVAVMNGYPAQTRMSIMKYPSKSRTLPSIARSLSEVGYHTMFTYGGDLNFTDQASYMYTTGWKELIWQKDMSFDAPTSKWGYADDVVGEFFAERVLDIVEQPRSEREPLLAGWLTLSSHEPFDVPYSKFKEKELNSVAFTDSEVGRVIDRLKESPAWENMVVVLVADHGYPYPEGTLYYSEARHRIPMLWVGGAVKEPMVVESYLSQMDLAATLLSQMGLPHKDFLFSKDVLSGALPEFGYWCFNDGFGVADEYGVTIFDCKSESCIVECDSTQRHLNIGKTLLQATYRDIRER